MEDKEKFFDSLHISLQEKYNLPRGSADTIRSWVLGYGWSREKLAFWLTEKLEWYRKNKKKPKLKYNPLLKFVTSATQEQWDDVIQKTQYDK